MKQITMLSAFDVREYLIKSSYTVNDETENFPSFQRIGKTLVLHNIAFFDQF